MLACAYLFCLTGNPDVSTLGRERAAFPESDGKELGWTYVSTGETMPTIVLFPFRSGTTRFYLTETDGMKPGVREWILTRQVFMNGSVRCVWLQRLKENSEVEAQTVKYGGLGKYLLNRGLDLSNLSSEVSKSLMAQKGFAAYTLAPEVGQLHYWFIREDGMTSKVEGIGLSREVMGNYVFPRMRTSYPISAEETKQLKTGFKLLTIGPNSCDLYLLSNELSYISGRCPASIASRSKLDPQRMSMGISSYSYS